MSRGVCLDAPTNASTSAPCACNSLHVLRSPYFAAYESAELPDLQAKFTSAPVLNNARTISKFLFAAAFTSAVHPASSLLSMYCGFVELQCFMSDCFPVLVIRNQSLSLQTAPHGRAKLIKSNVQLMYNLIISVNPGVMMNKIQRTENNLLLCSEIDNEAQDSGDRAS
eukprot:m.56602 g.56602  ORF g.56602 m.56602 type:complete len:168 (+) comp22268_c0_seq1:1060-1563(+)